MFGDGDEHGHGFCLCALHCLSDDQCLGGMYQEFLSFLFFSFYLLSHYEVNQQLRFLPCVRGMTLFLNLGPFFLTTITIRFSRLIPHHQYMVVYFLHFSLHHKVTLSLSPPSNWPQQEWVPFQSLLPDVANGRVGSG